MEAKQVVDGVYGYFERKFIGLLVFVGAVAGFGLAELATRQLTHSNTYYQQHALPRLFGACVAFALSNTIVWVARWSKNEDPVRYVSLPSKRDRERVGFLCYIPYAFFVLGIVVAFVEV